MNRLSLLAFATITVISSGLSAQQTRTTLATQPTRSVSQRIPTDPASTANLPFGLLGKSSLFAIKDFDANLDALFAATTTSTKSIDAAKLASAPVRRTTTNEKSSTFAILDVDAYLDALFAATTTPIESIDAAKIASAPVRRSTTTEELSTFASQDVDANLDALLAATTTPTETIDAAKLASAPVRRTTMTKESIGALSNNAWIALPLIMLGLFSFLLWGMFAWRNNEREEASSAEDTASHKGHSHHSQSSRFVSASKLQQEASNKRSTPSTTPISARVAEGPNSKPDFNNREITVDPIRSPVDFLYESELERLANRRKTSRTSSLESKKSISGRPPVSLDFDMKESSSSQREEHTELELSHDRSQIEGTVSSSASAGSEPTTSPETVGNATVSDNLTKINGLGKASQKFLNDNRIYSFSQLASITPEQLDDLFSGTRRFQMINTSTWPDQARELSAAQSDQEIEDISTELEMLAEINSLRKTAATATGETSAAKPSSKRAKETHK